jgi:3D (Asp-Asp-Asp) domain-containing protein
VKGHWTSDAARLAAVFTGLLMVASVPVALAADSSESRPEAGSLETRARSATLKLYALEASLGRARGELASLAARRAAVEREQAATRRQLTIARRAQRVSEGRLAELVRTLYQQPGHTDPLAIVLGAASLDEALSGIDTLSRAARENKRVIEQARASRGKLTRLDARLAARTADLSALLATTAARAEELEAAAAARQRYVADLRQQQGLNAARVASIEAQARAAEARSSELPSATAPAAAPTAAEPVRTLAAGSAITVMSTGYALRGRTSTGIPTGPGVVAVDPSVIPLGTRLTIPGYGVGIAADTGGAVQGNVIDVWFPTTQQALAWGRRTVTIVLG